MRRLHACASLRPLTARLRRCWLPHIESRALVAYPPRVVPGRDDILEPAPDRTSAERDRTRKAVSKHGYKFLLVAVGLLFIGISALVAVGCLSDHPSSLSLSKLESQAP
jgi:hypothetical protein